MSIDVKLIDGAGNGTTAKVSPYGHLVVGASNFSTAYAVTVALDNTGYNFVPPKAGFQFVITGLLLYANKNVGTGDATVVVYEASSPSTTTADKTVLTTEMLKQTSRDITGLNLIVTAGKWVNIKTDDNTVFSSLLGYYVET